MKMAIASAAAYLAVLGGAMDAAFSACEPAGQGTDPCASSGCVVPTEAVLRSSVGDGIWIVGKQIPAGTWTPPAGWDDKPACRWFVSPAEGGDATDLASWQHPSNPVPVEKGQSLTTIDCGTWKVKEES